MALSAEINSGFELLFNELLTKKENFRAIIARIDPIIHNKSDFFAAFFLGYLAHSYKQLFLLLKGREMDYEEINETLEYLMHNEAKIREILIGEYTNEPTEQISQIKESVEPVKVDGDKLDIIERNLDEIRQEINLIKRVAREQIAKYEINLIKKDEFEKSILN